MYCNNVNNMVEGLIAKLVRLMYDPPPSSPPLQTHPIVSSDQLDDNKTPISSL